MNTTVYPKPRGRSPKNKKWNSKIGEWESIQSNTNNYLSKLKLSELKKICKLYKIPEYVLCTIDDDDNPRIKLEEFIINNVQNTIINNNYIIYQGVHYLLDNRNNNLCDVDTFNYIGEWDSLQGNIKWNEHSSYINHREHVNNINNININIVNS